MSTQTCTHTHNTQIPGAFMMTGVGVAAAHTLTDPPAYLKAIIAGACVFLCVRIPFDFQSHL